MRNKQAFCISYLLLCNNLHQNLVASNNKRLLSHIFCDQESSGLAGPSDSGCVTRMSSSCQLGRQSPHSSTPEHLLSSSFKALLAGFSSSQVVWLMASFFHWILAWGLPQLHAPWASPLGPSEHGSWLHLSQQLRRARKVKEDKKPKIF